jgi:O-antigen/teichoic acid export membrane protein
MPILTPMARPSTFKKAFASTFALEMVSRGLSALTLVMLLRVLDVPDFAFIVLLLNVGNFLGSAATGGVRLRYTQVEAERISRGHEDPSAFHTALITGTWLVLVAAVLGYLGATLLDIAPPGERAVFAAIAAGFTAATAAVEMSIFHYQAQLAFLRAGIVRILRSLVLFIPALAAVFGLIHTGAAVGAGFAGCLGVLAAIVAIPLALASRGATRGKEGRYGFGRETSALTVYSLASAGWAYLDLFLVAGLLDNVAVAAYGAALRYVAIVVGPVPAMVSVLRVRTVQKDLLDSDEAQVAMMKRWARQTALPGAIILGLGAIASTWAIPLIDGGRYPDSVPIFQVMLVTAFVQFITLPNSSLLVAQKRYTLLAAINAIAIGVNVAVAIPAAAAIGVVGIAAAGALVAIAQVLTVSWYAARPPSRNEPLNAGVATPVAVVDESPTIKEVPR